MPIKIERALMKSAKKKGLTGERKNAYVYGTLQKIKKSDVNRYHKTRGKM